MVLGLTIALAASCTTEPDSAVDAAEPDHVEDGGSAGSGRLDAASGKPPAMVDAARPRDAARPVDATRAGDAEPAEDAAPLGTPPDAGMGADNEPTAPAATITSTDPTTATRAWWSYTRAATYTVISTSVMVPMRDGKRLGCKLGRPGKNGSPASGKFPGLVVEFTPYLLNASNNTTEAAYFTQRGYNTLVCTLRGIGDSEGTWQGAGSSQDWRDAHDLVEWLATQTFSDGRMGQFGESYGGQTTYGAALEQAPHLLAIAPMQPPINLYDDVNYPGGLETTAGGTINNWPPIAELLTLGAVSAQAEYDSWHAHPTFDAFWQERAMNGKHSALKVPVLTIGGWQDGFFRAGSLLHIEAALARTWAIYGQWEHLPPVDLGTCDSACVKEPLPPGVLLAWFDHWVMQLKDIPIPVKPTFVSELGPRADAPRWRELSTWIPGGVERRSYQLGADGTLAEAASPGARTFHEPGEASASGAALTFATAALEKDATLLGRARLKFRARLSASDANFYVQLLDVDAAGKEVFVNDGFLKASHRASHTQPEPVPVSQPLDYQLEIRGQHWRFAAGHRVRLRVWGGNADTVVQPSPVDVTIESGSLELPGFAGSP